MYELIPIKIFFGGFNGGYGKMWVYNLRSEFLKHKITIKDSKIEPWIARSKKQEHDSIITNLNSRIQEKLKDRIKTKKNELILDDFF